jgi:hypothetical protein
VAAPELWRASMWQMAALALLLAWVQVRLRLRAAPRRSLDFHWPHAATDWC